MANWDEDSPQLRKNLTEVLRRIRERVERRVPPSLSEARAWQKLTMRGLQAPDPSYVGAFRGEPGTEVEVYLERMEGSPVVRDEGVPAGEVAAALAKFEQQIGAGVQELDARIPPRAPLGEAELDDLIELAAYAHAEWVRIHPFANGNGRTARCWVNFILMRYGVDRLLQLRPRPDDGYGAAGIAAMQGDYGPTEDYLRRLILGP